MDAIDVFLQHPTGRFSADAIFALVARLFRWSRLAPLWPFVVGIGELHGGLLGA